MRAVSVVLESTAQEQTGSSVGFDWAVVGACAWFQFGAYLDGWAHLHLPELESFFTPWHAVLYSGFLAVAALTVGALLRNRARGRSWRQALPAGYELSLLGVLIFAAGGAGDMLWHLVFGIEIDFEALLSPTHLVLGFGATLIFTGPLRAAWRRPETSAQGVLQLPMLFSLAFLLSSFTFWTLYAHPLGRPWAAPGNRPTAASFPVFSPDPLVRGGGLISFYIVDALGVASVLLQAALLAGVVLLAVRRWGWSLPPGGFTLVFTVNAILMGFMRDQKILIPAAFLAGALGDLLLKWLRPSVARAAALRLFAFAVPAVYYLCYFVALKLTKGVAWSVHLWTGSVMLAGFVGLLLSYLVVPPRSAGQS